MLTRSITALSLACALCACSSAAELLVDLRTDYAPGVEFVTVEVHAVGAAAPVLRSVTRSDDFITGVRVAEVPVETGPVEVRVALLPPGGGDAIAERVIRVEVQDTVAVPVLIVRGETVGCESSSECVPPVASCAQSLCADGVCLVASDDGECAVGEWCKPDEGCLPLPAVDAGFDAAIDGMTDTGTAVDVGRDSIVTDTGSPDGGPPDAVVMDTGSPDTGATVTGLVAHYDCASLTPGIVPDVTGNGHDGVCTAGRCPTATTTAWGPACSFDGNDLVRIPHHPEFTPTGDFTVALWVRSDAMGGSLFGKVTRGGPQTSWMIAANASGSSWAFYTNDGVSSNDVLVGSGIRVGGFDHVAAVYEGGRKRLFINATEVADRAATISYDSGEVLLGAHWSGTTNDFYYDGLLAGVRFYDRALTASELRTISGL